MAEALIVGVDPGNTSAVAAVNLNGEIKLLESDRELPPRDIIKLLIQEGKPVVVACDTGKMPSTVEKVASSLGARKFIPEEDLDKERKKELGEGSNSHEKDAVASAMHAYKSLHRNIQKIKKMTEESEEDMNEIAERYFSGDMETLQSA